MKYEAYYLVEPCMALAEHLHGRVESDFADVLLEPRLYRRTEYDRSNWFEPQRLAQAKLIFLASLREYDPINDDAGFSAVFGSATMSIELFDQWFLIRRLGIDDDLDVLEDRVRAVIDRVVSPGIPIIDEWLLELRGQDAEQNAAADGGS